MLDDEDRDPRRVDPSHDIHGLVDLRGVEAREGLVEQQDLRVRGEGTGHLEQLPLVQVDLRRTLVGVAGEPDDRQVRLRLVTRVLEDDGFEDAVRDYLRGLTSVSTSAVALSKYLLYQIDGMTFDAAISAGADLNAVARLTDDCRAGIERFLEKN